MTRGRRRNGGADNAWSAFFFTLRNASLEQDPANQAKMQAAALLSLVNARPGVRDTVKVLAEAIGANLKDNRSGAELAAYACLRRSVFMGIAAGVQGKVPGVWKVGDHHIEELRSGKARVDCRAFNIVTRGEFEEEFGVWWAVQP